MSDVKAGKVLVVLHEEALGGATRALLRAIEPLEERGWTFAFWAPRPGPAFEHLQTERRTVEGAERLHGFSVRALRHPPGIRARIAPSVAYFHRYGDFLRFVSPDLVHANTVLALPEGLRARAAGMPCLLHVHDMLRRNLKGCAVLGLARAAQLGVVAVSEASAAPWRRGGLKPWIAHGSTPLSPPHPDTQITGRPLVVGTVGVISRRKGSDVFVAAAERVRRQRPGVEFRMIGSFPDDFEANWARAVLARAADAGVTHMAEADVFAEFASWDIFVLPSRTDPFPLVVLEAMASGLPVVGARSDGIPEQLAPGTGVLVEPDAPDALAQAIIDLCDDPLQRQRIGAAARERVAANFSAEAQSHELERAYRSTIGRSLPGRRAQAHAPDARA